MWNPCFDKTVVGRLLAMAVLAVLAACNDPVQTGEVKISDGWVRAVPPTSGATAAYFSLVNQSAVDLVIVGARSPVAPRAEMHEMTPVQGAGQEGASRMQRIERLHLAPGESADFETGGRHLMLMGMESAPQEGDWVLICLLTEEGDELCQDFPVKRSASTHNH